MKENRISEHQRFFKEESLANTLLKKWFWLYFFSYILGPLGYLIRIIISHSVSVQEVWILYSIIGFISLLSAYNWLGLTESLKYFIPQYYLKKQYDYIKTSVIWSLGVQILTSIVIVLFLYFGADWLANYYFHSPDAVSILQYFCIYFFAINIFQVLWSVFLSFQDTFNNKFIEFVRIVGITLFTLLFFWIEQWTLINYSLAWIFGLFLWLLISLIIFFRKYWDVFREGKLVYDKSMLYTFWRYSLWTFLSMNAGILLGMIDQQMVIIILWPESAGYYTNYQSLLNIFLVIISPIFMLLLPLFTEIFAKKDWKKLQLLQNFLYSYFGLFTLSLASLLAVLGPEIAVILYGEKFLLSGKLLMLGAVFYILNSLLSINFTILASMGKVKIKTFIALGVAGINIVLNVILLHYVGIYGAVISTIIGWFLLWFFSFRIVYNNCRIDLEWKFVVKNILLFVILGLVIYTLKDRVFVLEDSERFHNFVWLVIVGIVYYLIIGSVNFGKLKFLREEVKRLRKG